MVLPSCAAGEGKGAAGSSITIIPTPSLCCPKGLCVAALGRGVTLLTAVEGTQLAAGPAGFVHLCERACSCVSKSVCECDRAEPACGRCNKSATLCWW